ncbi:MAG: cobyric acid synthase CobQ, partial [Pseudomonadota bacterium]
RLEPDISFEWVPPGQTLPRDADLVILFGTKSTLGDLAFLRAQGWDHDVIAHARAGGRVLGICGGYQMLGHHISDPEGQDGAPGHADGLGLLDVETVMTRQKRVAPVQATCARSGERLQGYEIHIGQTHGPDTNRPFAHIDGRPEGAGSANGTVQGTYLHGVFAADGFRHAWLQEMAVAAHSRIDYGAQVDLALDALADGVSAAVDIDRLFALAR